MEHNHLKAKVSKTWVFSESWRPYPALTPDFLRPDQASPLSSRFLWRREKMQTGTSKADSQPFSVGGIYLLVQPLWVSCFPLYDVRKSNQIPPPQMSLWLRKIWLWGLFVIAATEFNSDKILPLKQDVCITSFMRRCFITWFQNFWMLSKTNEIIAESNNSHVRVAM